MSCRRDRWGTLCRSIAAFVSSSPSSVFSGSHLCWNGHFWKNGRRDRFLHREWRISDKPVEGKPLVLFWTMLPLFEVVTGMNACAHIRYSRIVSFSACRRIPELGREPLWTESEWFNWVIISWRASQRSKLSCARKVDYLDQNSQIKMEISKANRYGVLEYGSRELVGVVFS